MSSKCEKSLKAKKSDTSWNKRITKSSASKLDEVGKKVADVGVREDNCLDCGKLVLDTQHGLACDVCCFWYHCECEQVSDTVYEFLRKHAEDSSIAWYCKKCWITSRKFIGMISIMNEHQQQMEDKVSQLDRNLETRMDEMASRMSSQIEEMKSVEGKVNKMIETLEKQNSGNHEEKFLKLVEKLDSKLLTNTKTQFEGNIQLEMKIKGLHKKLDDKVDHISTQLEKDLVWFDFFTALQHKKGH
jgi:hypothetical protein